MKLKSLVVATALSVASLAANATSLDVLSGNFNWKLQGTSTEFHNAATPETGAGTYGDETTWAIGEITQINDNNGDPAWTGGFSDGTKLYYMIYGIADLSIIPGGGSSFNIYNIGCVGGGNCDGKVHVDIYRTAVGGSIPGILAKDPHTRIDFNDFPAITALSPYLKLEMVPGKVLVNDGSTLADETTAVLLQNAQSATLPTTGSGTFFAKVVGGTSASQWDTNGFLAGAADFDGNFTLKVNDVPSGGACTPTQIGNHTCFVGLINDPIQSQAAQHVPEPGTLALLGAALAGLGFTRRRQA